MGRTQCVPNARPDGRVHSISRMFGGVSFSLGQLELAYLVISRGIQGVGLMQLDGKYMEPELTEVRWC